MKKNTLKKGLALGMLLAIMVSSTGCNNSGKEEETAAGGNKITVWAELNATLSTKVTNFGETPLAKELSKRTGIEVEYVHPPQGQTTEAFNLLIASGKLPDVIRYNWFEQGAQKMINNKIILDLTEDIEKNAPNLKKLLKEHPDWDKQVKTDSGSYYTFPFFRGDKSLLCYTGPIVRKDWLDELGMEMPETIDDWEKMLTAFKEKKGADVPLSLLAYYFDHGFISGAFGVYADFYIDNGKVKYGPMEDGYLDFLTLLNKWYKAGLLDKNLASVDSKLLDTYMLNDRMGATVGLVGGNLGKWTGSMKAKNDKVNLVAATYPVLNKGDEPEMSRCDWDSNPVSGYAISAKTKNRDLAVKFLDYGYGEEGSMLLNFGIEGDTYEMVDGQPKFTQKMTDILNGNTQESTHFYSMGVYSGPLVQDKRLIEQTLVHDVQKDAYNIWSVPKAFEHKLPPVQYNDEESEIRTAIITDLTTYKEEMVMAFITGSRPLSEFDAFREQLKKIGVEEVLKVENSAYKRYQNR